MLSSLHIENIAVIKNLDVDFEKGFTAMTGETGAGKSIIIDSINMLMGGNMSVGEISEKLGFCDQFYFSRRFKKRFGLSPREYVKKSEG